MSNQTALDSIRNDDMIRGASWGGAATQTPPHIGGFPPDPRWGDCRPPAQVYLRTLFILFFSTFPPGDPGEGPDCNFPEEAVGLGPIPSRIRVGETYFLLLLEL